MNEVWNLDPIYKGFDDPAFAADMETLTEKARTVAELAAALPAMDPLQGLKEGILQMEELMMLTAKLAVYASLRQSTNTRDPECGSRLGVIFQILSGTAGPRAIFNEWAAALPDLEALAESDALLKETRPEYAFISVGFNGYGHPSDSTLQKLHRYGAEVYRTDLDGSITFMAGDHDG